jgi:hypothetical protein
MTGTRDENFRTTKLISLLSDVEDVYSNDQVTEVANSFYNTFLLYLEKLSNNVLPLVMIHWTLLRNPPAWEKILHSTKHNAMLTKNMMKMDFLVDLFILQI